jgi:hypothetical protein
MIAVYRDETQPLTLRVQCAALAAPYERPRLTAVAAQITLGQSGASGDDPGEALVASILRRAEVARRKFVPSEVIPPDPVAGKHKPRPPLIDGAAAQRECDTAEKSEQFQQVADGYADKQSPGHQRPADRVRVAMPREDLNSAT